MTVEPREPDDCAEKLAHGKVERHDVVLTNAVQATVGSESQPPRSTEAERAVRNEDAHELSGNRVVFADAHGSIGSAERALARNHDMTVRSQRQIKRAQLGVAD